MNNQPSAPRLNLLNGLRWFSALLAVLILVPAQAENAPALSIPSGAYEVDPTHAYITFSYSHLGFSKPQLGFNRFSVDLKLDSEQLEGSTFEVVIDAASIDSRVEKFDDHLKGGDFFAVDEYPEIRFVSRSVKRTGAETAEVTGDLTIRGQTQPQVLTIQLEKAAMHPMLKRPVLGVSATGTLQRSAFGLGKYAPAVGDEVTLNITAELMSSEKPEA